MLCNQWILHKSAINALNTFPSSWYVIKYCNIVKMLCILDMHSSNAVIGGHNDLQRVQMRACMVADNELTMFPRLFLDLISDLNDCVNISRDMGYPNELIVWGIIECLFTLHWHHDKYYFFPTSLTIAELDSTLIIFKYKVTFGDNIN